MEKSNPVLDKSFQFAVHIVEVHRHLTNERKEFVLSKQLLRSGTSVGANVHEAQAAQTKPDFIAKMSIASKEARETLYWLNLLKETAYLNAQAPQNTALISQCHELNKLLTSIVKTAQENLKNTK